VVEGVLGQADLKRRETIGSARDLELKVDQGGSGDRDRLHLYRGGETLGAIRKREDSESTGERARPREPGDSPQRGGFIIRGKDGLNEARIQAVRIARGREETAMSRLKGKDRHNR